MPEGGGRFDREDVAGGALVSAFPRQPADDAEREACASSAEVACCMRRPDQPYNCARVAEHDGDHVASDGRYVLARWPQVRADAAPADHSGADLLDADGEPTGFTLREALERIADLCLGVGITAPSPIHAVERLVLDYAIEVTARAGKCLPVEGFEQHAPDAQSVRLGAKALGRGSATTLRGPVRTQFRDGVVSVHLPPTAAGDPRVVYLTPEELPGAKVGDLVTIRFEVTRE